ncbi:hypothetical protein [Brevundimonas sp. EAKA]|uniref:hypothetical protein n=1 Tax=Brevundimonas sp. EAKA TaxID=1495854 RepID=UPI0012DD4648|nr:hypothetical protein [Brevundimonas sp. EAKA]
MDPVEIITELLLGVVVDVTAEQINELIRQLLDGANNAVMTGGRGDVVEALSKGLEHFGGDVSGLSDADWYQVASAFVAAS